MYMFAIEINVHSTSLVVYIITYIRGQLDDTYHACLIKLVYLF